MTDRDSQQPASGNDVEAAGADGRRMTSTQGAASYAAWAAKRPSRQQENQPSEQVQPSGNNGMSKGITVDDVKRMSGSSPNSVVTSDPPSPGGPVTVTANPPPPPPVTVTANPPGDGPVTVTANPPPTSGDPNPPFLCFHFTGKLLKSQINAGSVILAFASENGYSGDVGAIIINQAFYESSLGLLESNPTNSNVEGMFQYDADTWSDLGHSDLDRSNDNDQIAAMFDDYDTYQSRYAAGQANGTIPSSLAFEDYFELKHHLGNNYTGFNSDAAKALLKDFSDKLANLGLYPC